MNKRKMENILVERVHCFMICILKIIVFICGSLPLTTENQFSSTTNYVIKYTVKSMCFFIWDCTVLRE